MQRIGRWYAHIALIFVAEFAAEAARGLVLPSLFPYVQLLDQPTTTADTNTTHAPNTQDTDDDRQLVFLGLLTALFSAGRFISSLLFGCLSDRLSFSTLYHVSAAVAISGNLLYVLPYSPHLRSKPLLAASRFLVGFGAGNRSVCRANIAALTPLHQRLSYFTLFATVVFLAYALTPGLGGIVGDIDVAIAGSAYWHFNRFTAPGYLLVAFNVLVVLLNVAVYDASITRDDAPGSGALTKKNAISSGADGCDEEEAEQKVKVKIAIAPPPSTTTTASVDVGGSTESVGDASERMVLLGVVVFIFQNFISRGILSVFETVNMPLYEKVVTQAGLRDDTSADITTSASQFYLALGLLGLITYAVLHYLGQAHHSVNDVKLVVGGFVALVSGNALLLLWSIFLEDKTHVNGSWELLVAAEMLVWSIGCPITSAVVVSAFSQVLGTRPQGTLMGIFGSSASIARMVMPFLPGLLPSWEWLFLINIILCISSLGLLGLYLRRKSHLATNQVLQEEPHA